MTAAYRIFSSELSPYSVKVRSFLRYKGRPYEWLPRRGEAESEFRRIARLPIVPTLVTPDGDVLQDSTPIIERLEAQHPKPSIHPPSATLAFLSALLEEFGDEWGNKLMFHSRWWAEVDQTAAANTVARLRNPSAGPDELKRIADETRERMLGRRRFVGSSAANAPLLERWFIELVDLLELHLRSRRYLFGARPAFGDFGLAPELYEAALDPTCGSILRSRGVAVLDWAFRMVEPRNDGPFETWEKLEPTLKSLLAYVGKLFLPWSAGNARALAADEAEFGVTLDGAHYVQQPQKYHARSLRELRAKFDQVKGAALLRGILSETGCLAWLEQPPIGSVTGQAKASTRQV